MRRPQVTAAPAISLFPFLAVLLCTMGALIVVLVVLNRQSRLRAATLAAGDSAALNGADADAAAEDELRRDALAWQLEHLRVSRDKTQVDLDHARLRLGGIEEHRRNLEARLVDLKRAVSELDVLESATHRSAPANELARLKAEIDAARRELDDTRRRIRDQPQTYSVVTYEGPNRTRRRPIYIECLDDRVILQPEGIVLNAADFSGPPGPGNPLASAVRAARDHIVAAAADPKSPEEEPYPLFLVRPDGIAAYYAARAAMASWGSDFGYQTIDQEWKIDYPPSDVGVAQAEQQAVDEARERLRWLAQMSPDRFGAGGERRGGGNRSSYRVSPMGGLVREGGPSLRGSTADISLPKRNRSGFDTRGDDSFAMMENRAARQEARATDSASGKSVAHGDLAPSASPAQGDYEKHSSLTGSSNKAGMNAGRRDNRSKEHDSSAGETTGLQAANEKLYGDLNDRARVEAGRSSSFDAQGPSKTDPETGETQVQVSVQPQSRAKPRRLAEVRGANWGLLPGARSSNPITRPIHIICEGDKLVIRPQAAGDAPVEVPLRLRTEDSVDPLVAAVQQRIKDWGIAGRGLYWRPQLILEVGKSGEGRYADIEALMADSGFDVKRRE
jgi:hypothetical protein